MPRINLQQLDAICAAIDSDLRGQGASHPSSQPAQRLADAVQRAAAQNGVPIAAADVVQALQTYRLNPADLEPARLRLLLTVLAGDQALRAHEAFTVLDEEGHGAVPPERLQRLMTLFEIPEETTKEIALEVVQDGSETLTRDKFCRYLSEEFSAHPRAYAAGLARPQASAPETAPMPRTEAPAHAAASATGAAANPPRADKITGTSQLQIQIGLFRLLQGAAYRSFRESYSANCETHLRAFDLPYTIPDFCRFVTAAVDFYLALGIVQPGAEQPFTDLKASVTRAEAELRDRMARWDPLAITDAMREAEDNVERELSELDHHHQIFASVVELLLSGALLGHRTSAITLEDLQHHELNRLRQLEDHKELSGNAAISTTDGTRRSFLETWQRVIVDSADTRYAGSILPTAYWYEEFMPLLLKACAVLTPADLHAWESATEAELDAWFAQNNAAGAFERYGQDVKQGFPTCTKKVKQEVKPAWELSHHYLNGVQKRRERAEFGRESGYLSQYVAFIDVYLGRDDVEKSEMRLSFPYYLGPATWCFLHTSAELISAMPAPAQQQPIQAFKTFFKTFATMYPCPYCRFHLNRYVVKNREFSMYPIEYLLLGAPPDGDSLEVSIDDKIAVVRDGESLRFFLWKLHNAVSSSIARSEEWFHKDQTAFYTSRYWPSLDAELERAHTLSLEQIHRDRIQRVYGVVKHAAHLSILRSELQDVLGHPDAELRQQIRSRADLAIGGVEKAVMDSRFLHDHYTYNPDLQLEPPHFSPAEEALARSGYFTED